MADARYYIRTKNGDYGPMTRRELADWAERGMFTSEDRLWHHRLGKWEWVAAKHIAQLQGLFRDMAAEEAQIDAALAEAKRIKATDRGEGKSPTQLIAIGGGKGGTGKTSIGSALAISLASLDRYVVLVDGDLGGANVHTCLGMTQSAVNLGRFFMTKGVELTEVMLKTPIPNLQLISGAGGILGLANPKYSQKLKFINRMRKLDADYVVIDLGAGTTYDTLDLFLAADLGIVICSPDPFSLQNGFNFIKAATYRMLDRTFRKDLPVQELLQRAKADGYRKALPPLLDATRYADEACVERMEAALAAFHPGLIANMVMKRREARESLVVTSAAAELLGINVDYLGMVYFDANVRASLRRMQPFVVSNPRSPAAKCVLDIVVRKVLRTSATAGFWKKRRMRKRLRAAVRPAPSPDAANEAAIYEDHTQKS